jgi:hypothetical protein
MCTMILARSETRSLNERLRGKLDRSRSTHSRSELYLGSPTSPLFYNRTPLSFSLRLPNFLTLSLMSLLQGSYDTDIVTQTIVATPTENGNISIFHIATTMHPSPPLSEIHSLQRCSQTLPMAHCHLQRCVHLVLTHH